MTETLADEIATAPRHAPTGAGALADALRTAGAAHIDPVRLHYIDVLAKRAQAHQGSVRRILDAKLEQALAALSDRIAHARRGLEEAVAHGAQRHPHAAGELRRLLAAGDLGELRRRLAALANSTDGLSLADLTRRLGQHSASAADARGDEHPASVPELKTVRKFRNTWSKLSVDKQLAQALEQGPKNAGPINSHMLVLRSLALMQEVSPDYLNRFISYADTLLCLDRCEKEKPGAPRKAKAMKAAKK